LVARLVWDQEVESSNLSAPIFVPRRPRAASFPAPATWGLGESGGVSEASRLARIPREVSVHPAGSCVIRSERSSQRLAASAPVA
jgi:hypothetical protein